MAKADTASARAPRGSKPVSQAFFAALDSAPEIRRAEIAKAAQIMIRDELKIRRDRAKASAQTAKEKARKPAPAPRAVKAAAKPAKAAKAAAAKPAAKAAAPAKAVFGICQNTGIELIVPTTAIVRQISAGTAFVGPMTPRSTIARPPMPAATPQ